MQNQALLTDSMFGKTDKVLDRTELVVLLTPRLIKNELDAKLVTREFKLKLTGIYQELENEEGTASTDQGQHV